MSILEIIFAFWIAGVALAMWKIWFPSLKIIKAIQPENIFTERPILSSIVVVCIFFLTLPFMVIPLLIPNKLEQFASSFIRGATSIKK